jgi:hypothetical protein
MGYLLIAFVPSMAVFIGAFLGGNLGPLVPGTSCSVLKPWIDVPVYILMFYYGFGVFTLVFIARHLRLGASPGEGATRSLLQLVVFTLAFACTWVWIITRELLPNTAPALLKARVTVADAISFGLVGFTNSCVWFLLSHKRPNPVHQASLTPLTQSTLTQPLDSNADKSTTQVSTTVFLEPKTTTEWEGSSLTSSDKPM